MSRAVMNGVMSDGSACPMADRFASTFWRPSRWMRWSAAVLSLMEIIPVANASSV